MNTTLVVGGSSGLGRFIAERLAARGDAVVLTSRDSERAHQAAAEIGGRTRGIAVDWPDRQPSRPPSPTSTRSTTSC